MADSERLVRGTVSQASDMNLRELQVNLQDDEVRDNLEHAEPYGFSSEPFLDGDTDAFAGFFDDSREHGIVFCVSDRRYRVKQLKQGEVVLYDDKGRKVYFRREGMLIDGADDPITVQTNSSITVNAATTITVNAGSSITLNTQTVNINASETTVSGHMTVLGGLNARGGSGVAITGNVAVNGGITATDDMVSGSISAQHHIHTGVQPGGGSTGEPQ